MRKPCTNLHIRDGIQWHDGEKFTADDVKFTIEAIMIRKNADLKCTKL